MATSSVGEDRYFQSENGIKVSSIESLDKTSSLVVQADTATTPLSTLTSTPTPSSPPIQSQQSQSPNSTARIIGLTIGLAIADILLVGLCLYFFFYRRLHNLSLLRLKKRFARDKNNNEAVAELRGPPVYAQEREDEGAQYEVHVEPSEVQGTVCYHELAACAEVRMEERGRR
ncbi:hypothetical protein PTNB73_06036 [Pyrenophora teres f. teres]|uniref:Uncharacterized protein n=2 Tax=Pyrenophora teres f. teres TaxID=97479 RepID=E3S568_PYRTT|nr:hypothetical protein PTT_17744 [Pyrenophora teres f. teres 0-1]KAE8828833.1 hypothetical protein PTNB85_08021 [Pyrenophora teres f. teres]KAE8829995.1 hypothetical protein HRS9139_06619 [Pyrenophora teres f. teres]KAE8841666.1 hypothetical protein HRS9122_05792 [Pyrenophora teres f. teres]KAE8859769.1 hypothetical protein PTNB29_07000 [Pyrenophora teres f. teres]